jgi:hypothetical protein
VQWENRFFPAYDLCQLLFGDDNGNMREGKKIFSPEAD